MKYFWMRHIYTYIEKIVWETDIKYKKKIVFSVGFERDRVDHTVVSLILSLQQYSAEKFTLKRNSTIIVEKINIFLIIKKL